MKTKSSSTRLQQRPMSTSNLLTLPTIWENEQKLSMSSSFLLIVFLYIDSKARCDGFVPLFRINADDECC
ncbi:hypothetical protein T4B_8834 [Trichinella pseudospiralis]|uniref:Uncharacterized protein n=1 Tax=Trichinella pseudospiralis TaxID=6337 RepID=A0A0V1IF48_TRIPS|nr:hypothetical protein T4B_8834 [Trichinella pseudospiralis]